MQILARTNSSGTTAWYMTDQLGSVRDIDSTSGTRSWTRSPTTRSATSRTRRIPRTAIASCSRACSTMRRLGFTTTTRGIMMPLSAGLRARIPRGSRRRIPTSTGTLEMHRLRPPIQADCKNQRNPRRFRPHPNSHRPFRIRTIRPTIRVRCRIRLHRRRNLIFRNIRDLAHHHLLLVRGLVCPLLLELR